MTEALKVTKIKINKQLVLTVYKCVGLIISRKLTFNHFLYKTPDNDILVGHIGKFSSINLCAKKRSHFVPSKVTHRPDVLYCFFTCHSVVIL